MWRLGSILHSHTTPTYPLGDAVDEGLYKAGAWAFTFMFFALLAAVGAAVTTNAALLGQSSKLRPRCMKSKGVK